MSASTSKGKGRAAQVEHVHDESCGHAHAHSHGHGPEDDEEYDDFEGDSGVPDDPVVRAADIEAAMQTREHFMDSEVQRVSACVSDMGESAKGELQFSSCVSVTPPSRPPVLGPWRDERGTGSESEERS